MSFPSFVGAGAEVESTTTGTPQPHANTLIGDLLLLLVETSNQLVATPSGWTPIPNSPQGAAGAGATSATRLSIFQKAATVDGASGGPLLADPGDHFTSTILSFRHPDGTPTVHETAGDNTGTSTGASLSAVGPTTTLDECLILVAVAKGTDTTSSLWSAWSNANLANLAEVYDASTNAGNGGNMGAAIGELAIAGDSGTTTATGGGTAAARAWLTVAIAPPVFVPGSFFFDGSNDKVEYSDAPSLDALNLSDYLILAWARPGDGGHNNGRIFSRANSVEVGPVGHMQLMIGNGAVGTRDTNFTGRQRHVGAGSTLAVSATGIVPNDSWSCLGMHYQGGVPRIFEAGALVTPATTLPPSGAQDMQSDEGVTIGNSSGGDRAFLGQLAYIAIWDVSSLSDGEVETLVSDFYNGGTGTPAVPRQDILVEFIRLYASGSPNGDKGVLTSPTVVGAIFTVANPPPVTYQELGSPVIETDNFFAFI